MAQLSDDCFAFGGALMTVDEALSRIDARTGAVADGETAPLLAAAGRILARDLVAAMNLPPHANSAVDGYAFAHADLLSDRDTVLRARRPRRGGPSARSADRPRRGGPHLHRRADARGRATR